MEMFEKHLDKIQEDRIFIYFSIKNPQNRWLGNAV